MGDHYHQYLAEFAEVGDKIVSSRGLDAYKAVRLARETQPIEFQTVVARGT
jgi:hypothetical protein